MQLVWITEILSIALRSSIFRTTPSAS